MTSMEGIFSDGFMRVVVRLVEMLIRRFEVRVAECRRGMLQE